MGAILLCSLGPHWLSKKEIVEGENSPGLRDSMYRDSE